MESEKFIIHDNVINENTLNMYDKEIPYLLNVLRNFRSSYVKHTNNFNTVVLLHLMFDSTTYDINYSTNTAKYVYYLSRLSEFEELYKNYQIKFQNTQEWFQTDTRYDIVNCYQLAGVVDRIRTIIEPHNAQPIYNTSILLGVICKYMVNNNIYLVINLNDDDLQNMIPLIDDYHLNKVAKEIYEDDFFWDRINTNGTKEQIDYVYSIHGSTVKAIIKTAIKEYRRDGGDYTMYDDENIISDIVRYFFSVLYGG
jgi:hypothetical protein